MIVLLALLQVHMSSPADEVSGLERAALTEAVAPYARCINAHLPTGYFAWSHQRPISEAELRSRVDTTAEAFIACKDKRSSVTNHVSTDIERAKLVMFVDRLEDSYTYPVIVGSDPTLLIDPRKSEDARASN